LKRLDLYLIKNFIPPLFAAVAFFTFIIMLFYLKEIIKEGIEKGLPIAILGELIFNSIGWTLAMTVPMASLLATLIAVGKHNADSEIIAMRAAGISYPRIFLPLLYVAVVICISQFYLSNEVFPNAKAATDKTIQKIRDFDPTMLLEKGQFTVIDRSVNGDRTLYYEENSLFEGREFLKNVQIRRTSIQPDGGVGVVELIIAERALRVSKEIEAGSSVKALRLFKGYMFIQSEQSAEFKRIDFHNGFLDINIQEVEEKVTKTDFQPESTVTSVLRKKIDEFNIKDEGSEKILRRYKMEVQKRTALPFAVISLTFLGFPLAIVNRRSGKGQGFGMAIVFIFLYFGLFLSSDTLAVEKALLSEAFAAWLGNIVVIVFALSFSQFRLSHELLKERIRGISSFIRGNNI
jgi:lipopolysaccharide export system permease protein